MLQIFATLIPLIVLIVGAVLRLPTYVIALVTLLSGIGVSAWLFPVTPDQVGQSALGLAPTAAEVILIIFGGLLLNRLLDRTGALLALADVIADLCDTEGSVNRSERLPENKRVTIPELSVILIVLGLGPFLESVTGFGVGIIILIPLLLHLGFGPARSAILGLLGTGLTSWGALAPALLVGAQQSRLPLFDFEFRSALLAGVLWYVMAITALLVAYGARKLTVRRVLESILYATVGWIGLIVATMLFGSTLAGAISGIFVVGAVLLKLVAFDRVSLRVPRSQLVQLRPFLFLVLGLVVASLIIRATGLVNTPAAWLAHGSVWLLITCAYVIWSNKLPRNEVIPMLKRTLQQWWPVALTVAALLAFGTLWSVNGAAALIGATVGAIGFGYIALAPVIGALSGYVTSSSTAANAMFSSSQALAAHSSGVSVLQVGAAQNVLAGFGTLLSPAKLALAHSVVSTPIENTPPERETADHEDRESAAADKDADHGAEVAKSSAGLGYLIKPIGLALIAALALAIGAGFLYQ